MDLKDILSIAGEGGVFRFLAQGRNAVIVEHLQTGKRHSATAASKISSLEDIAIFTMEEDMRLGVVFDRIWDKEQGGRAIDHKSSSAALKEYFAEVVPNYDTDRVYVSDIKKVVQWYNTLHDLDLLKKEEQESAEEEATEEQDGHKEMPGSERDNKEVADTDGERLNNEESPDGKKA